MLKIDLLNGQHLYIIWQKIGEEGIAEPALSIRNYPGGIIEIQQDKQEIVLNKETLPELIKILKLYQKESE